MNQQTEEITERSENVHTMGKSEMSKPVCLITGVGEGTGAALARRFAKGGYQVAMLARNRERLESLATQISDSKIYLCDVGDLDSLHSTLEAVRTEMGPPSVLVHNVVSAQLG